MTCNTYEELGRPDPIEMLRKAQIVRTMERTIRQRNLSISRAAKLMGLSTQRLDLILGGRFRSETPELLLNCLRRLGHDIVVEVKPEPSSGGLGEFHLIPPLIVT
jgi:predicted XRE-type DNA-binding protein